MFLEKVLGGLLTIMFIIVATVMFFEVVSMNPTLFFWIFGWSIIWTIYIIRR